MTRFCISHQQPLLPRGLYDICVALGTFNLDDPWHISRLDPYWHGRRPLAYGAAGSYALPKALARLGSALPSRITITSYRKCVSSHPLGKPSAAFSAVREVPLEESQTITADSLAPVAGHEFLVTAPFELGSVLTQYGQAHMLQDLLDYASLAIEYEILSNAQTTEFLSGSTFIPGGCELGSFPAEFLRKSLSLLAFLGMHFLDRYADRVAQYDPYQVRALGFLSERLGSYLLLRELTRRYPAGIPNAVFGHMICLTSDGENYQAARS